MANSFVSLAIVVVSIVGFFGSAAQAFDQGHGVSPKQFGRIDIDGNGAVDAVDVQLGINGALGISIGSFNADVNNDGDVNAVDVQVVINAALGILPENLAPIITSQPIYLAYPGFAIALPIAATDPENTDLTFVASSAPAGASLDAITGMVTWTPTDDDIGPAYIQFTVSDEGDPAESSDGVLIFQIVPPEDCVDAVCDAATGCDFQVKPITEACCTEEPTVRIAEPEAPCPEGRVLHVGRNGRGFGRLQNCDFVQIVPFAQGGANITLHFESRCVNDAERVTIEARMETATEVVFERSQSVSLTARPDGFSHALGLNWDVGFETDIEALEGAEALLSVTLTDADETVVERQLRVTLTLAETEDLPNPIQVVPPSNEVGCISCHRPMNPITMERQGIKDAHPFYPLSCTDCHGGNDQVNTFTEAHVFPESGPTFLKNLAYDQLNEVPLDYLQFINPGDLRVAQKSCGSASPAADGGGCHDSIIQGAPSSVMATYAGHYKLPRFLAGGQDRDPTVAAVDIVDELYDPETAPEGTVEFLTALREPDEATRSTILGATDIYLAKSCATCHLSDFGRNNGTGKYRSSGCTACHMLYDDDGLSRSEDPAILGYFPPHPVSHELTSAITVEQCTHCHFQGGRIGLSYQGIREGGFNFANTPRNAVPWGKSIYGHGPTFYFTDEDSTNDYDETPPDIHHDAGMVCADCHVGSDVHGDGFIYASELDQVGIRCEDCHGEVREAIVEDTDGLFKNSKGYALKRLRRDGDQIVMKLATQDVELPVPQIFNLLNGPGRARMKEAMGVNELGYAHPDSMECYTCHNQWRQTCLGCHVTVNDDSSQLNLTTGEISQGSFTSTRNGYLTDLFTLGVNKRGKISSLCSSMSMFMSYRKDGELQLDRETRVSSDGTKGFGWNPFHHHTTSRTPMNCDSCHPVGSIETPSNAFTLNETYGFGNEGRPERQVTFEDGQGVVHDLTAFLNAEGELDATFPHPNTGPVPTDIRERALSILVTPHPR
jgi:hypothetical protein